MTVSRFPLLVAVVLLAGGATGVPDGKLAKPRPAPSRDRSGIYAAFLTGRIAASQADFDVSADNFLRALAADPGNPELLQSAFVASLVDGRPDALRLARRMGDNPAAALLLADAEAKDGRWEQAEQRFRALPRQPTMQVLLVIQPLLVAWSQLGAGHADQAMATLRPYAEGTRLRGVYALHAALIADAAGKTQDASRLYRVAQSALDGTNLRLTQIMASWQARQGRVEEARATLDALAEAGDGLAIALPGLVSQAAARPVPRAVDGLAEAYMTMGAALREQEATDMALLMLRLAIDLRPDLTPARLLLADLLEGGKHPHAAFRALDQVPSGDPLAPLVRLRRAALQDVSGEKDAAHAALEQIAREYPESAAPHIQQGDAYRAESRFPDAVTAYDRAVERLNGPRRASWPVFYARGIALERSHDWPRAEADMRRALDLSPEQPFVLNYLAYSWADQGVHLREARDMIERAIAQRPNDGAIIDSLGWVELRQGETHAAVGTLEKAAELEPDDPTINGHLGDAYFAAGRHDEAEFQWRRALVLNPDPDDATKLQAKLRDPAQAALQAAVPERPATRVP